MLTLVSNLRVIPEIVGQVSDQILLLLNALSSSNVTMAGYLFNEGSGTLWDHRTFFIES